MTADQDTPFAKDATAYSYLRFSTSRQSNGDSLQRQQLLAASYARRYGLDLNASLTYADLGVSSYHSQNAISGRLSAFVAAIDNGIVPANSVLLVENLDRLSRDNALQAQGLLYGIINKGVVIVTLSDERVYSAKTLKDDPLGLIFALLTFIRANEESQIKSVRSKAVWQRRREAATEQPMPGRLPVWITLDKKTKKFALVEPWTTSVRRVFELAGLGLSPTKIADRLNVEGARCWAATGFWSTNIVRRLLYVPAAAGVMQPHRTRHVNGRVRRIPLAPLPGYYPAAISMKTWLAAQDMLAGRYKAGGALKRNLFRDLARCGLCNSPMCWAEGEADGSEVLRCKSATHGSCEDFAGYDYAALEKKIILHLPYALLDAALEASGRGGSSALFALQEQVDYTRKMVRAGLLPSFNAEKAAWELEDAIEEQACTQPDGIRGKLIDALINYAPTEGRRRITRHLLLQFIKKITLQREEPSVLVDTVDGDSLSLGLSP